MQSNHRAVYFLPYPPWQQKLNVKHKQHSFGFHNEREFLIGKLFVNSRHLQPCLLQIIYFAMKSPGHHLTFLLCVLHCFQPLYSFNCGSAAVCTICIVSWIPVILPLTAVSLHVLNSWILRLNPRHLCLKSSTDKTKVEHSRALVQLRLMQEVLAYKNKANRKVTENNFSIIQCK